MRWFRKQKELQVKVDPFVKTEDRSSELAREAQAELFKAQRKDAEREALLKIDSYRIDAESEWNEDKESYSFSCKRWGDFLSLFIERNGSKFATSINLAATRSISLIGGHPADINGQIQYFLKNYSETNGREINFKKKVWARLPSKPLRIGFEIECNTPGNSKCYAADSYWWIRLEPTPFVRYAGDDRVVFSGIGATIRAPFGRGQEVLDCVLKTTAGKA